MSTAPVGSCEYCVDEQAAGRLVCRQCGRAFPPVEGDNGVEFGPRPGASVINGRLWLQEGFELPPHCVRCNVEVDEYTRSKFHSYPTFASVVLLACFLLSIARANILYLLAGILAAIVIQFLARKTVVVHLPVCKKHQTQYVVGKSIGWVGALTALVAFFVAGLRIFGLTIIPIEVRGTVQLGSVIMFFSSIIVGAVMGRILRSPKVKDGTVTLKGAHPEFLNLVKR